MSHGLTPRSAQNTAPISAWRDDATFIMGELKCMVEFPYTLIGDSDRGFAQLYLPLQLHVPLQHPPPPAQAYVAEAWLGGSSFRQRFLFQPVQWHPGKALQPTLDRHEACRHALAWLQLFGFRNGTRKAPS